ncbi:MAG: DUF6051 family protein [Mangrovibacterium sp.]
MTYLDSYNRLRELLSEDSPFILFDDLAIYRQTFRSASQDLLPGREDYRCRIHKLQFCKGKTMQHDIGDMDDMIHIPDNAICQNETFSYPVFMPANQKRAGRAIFLLHGFNEKNWDKYLPWARHLALRTKSAVILFPIAFHMNRTLEVWSNRRKMYQLCEKRKKRFPQLSGSSLTNVAISMRLHNMPQRFIWSGLQTYADIIRLIQSCKEGSHPLISPDAAFHFTAYSIGCLLGEILKFTNPNGWFTHSRLALFCGGAVFNRMSPVSRYILDSEANIALYSFLIEHMGKNLEQDPRLRHYIQGPHPEGPVFHAMLDYHKNRDYRENLIRRCSRDILAISLKQDSIIPPYEVVNTLQGASRDIPVKIDILDFPFAYNHVTPFPPSVREQDAVNEKFSLVFDRIASFILGNDKPDAEEAG